jgi:hypothetical protein
VIVTLLVIVPKCDFEFDVFVPVYVG